MPKHSEPLTDTFKALSLPVRIRIIDLLREGEQCVCHLEAYTGERQAYLSQQLRLMQEAGLIIDRKDGWYSYYRAADERIFALVDLARDVYGRKTDLKNLKIDCPCPKCKASESKCHPQIRSE
jgi:ArsR family transcriptional regulator